MPTKAVAALPMDHHRRRRATMTMKSAVVVAIASLLAAVLAMMVPPSSSFSVDRRRVVVRDDVDRRRRRRRRRAAVAFRPSSSTLAVVGTDHPNDDDDDDDDDRVIVVSLDEEDDEDDEDDDAHVVVVVASSPSPPPPPHPMPLRSIGVDYGLVRTGIAVTTSGGYSPRPLAILTGYVNNSASLSSRILDLALSERASDIVLGLPLHKNGTHSEQSNITRSFGRYLARETRRRCGRHGARVVLYDERYTSKEARSRIAAECMSGNGRVPSKDELSGTLDADAACIILEQYYRDGGWVHAEVVAVEDGSDEAEECDAAYATSVMMAERARLEMKEERERRSSVRREMIDRDRAAEKEEAALAGEDEENGRSSKKKKKKKKKKKT